MKKILGLDLGTNSIGWALIEHDFDNKKGEIIDLGSRIIPMTQDVLGKFDSGVSISQTAERTGYRGVRRLNQRQLLRRERLLRVLNILGFLPKHYSNTIDFDKKKGQFKPEQEEKIAYYRNENEKYQFYFIDTFNEMVADFKKTQPQLFENGKLIPYDWTIYYLRKKALSKKLTNEELAWLLLNFNQKRGYYQLRGEDEETKLNIKEFVLTLKIIKVEKGEKDKSNPNKNWYNIILENNWIYSATFMKEPQWIDTEKEFLIIEEFDDKGNIKIIKDKKKDVDGKEKRKITPLPSFEEIDLMSKKEQDKIYKKIKIKTEITISNSGKTVGAYIYDTLLNNPSQKINGKLVRTIERKFYKDELKAILTKQIELNTNLQSQSLYKECIEELYPKNDAHRNSISFKDFSYLLIDDIIFYQRPLKSKVSLISDCPFEFKKYKDGKGETKLSPIKCIAKSNPIFQEFRLWQFISNLKIYKRGLVQDEDITCELIKNENDYVELFEFLNDKEDITQKQFLAYYKLKETDHRWNMVEDKIYPCNETRGQLLSKTGKIDGFETAFFTTEITSTLWHILYSVSDKIELKSAITKFVTKNKLPEESITILSRLKPYKNDYGSYSEKAIKKLLPLMRMGKYWKWENIDDKTKLRIQNIITGEYDESLKNKVREKAINLTTEIDFKGLPLWLSSYIVYDRHSESNDTTKWNSPADVDYFLKHIFKQHSLHNPIVEQVITETLRTVNDIWKIYGNGEKDFFDEIHIELGREMKNPADKRKRMTEQINANENTNLRIKAVLQELMNEVKDVRPYSPSQQEILKIYEEGVYSNENEKDKLEEVDKFRKNNKPTKDEIKKYKLWLEQGYISPYTGQPIMLSELFTRKYEIEHIFPQSRFFDDSLTNKVICETEVNGLKGNQTAMEFIKNHSGSKVELSGGKHITLLTVDNYKKHIELYYGKNKSKVRNLLSEEIPESFINRQLNDSRYISKVVKMYLSKIVRENKDGVLEQEATSKNIVPVTGSITSRMKQDWGLNDVWNTIITPRFERLNTMSNSNKYGQWENKNGKNIFQTTVPDEIAKGFSKKRIDHRHHAMDALVIACITKDHINYLNSINSENKNYSLVSKLRRTEEIVNDGKKMNVPKEFHKPWQDFTHDTKEQLLKTIVSFKQNTRVINKTVNKYQKYVEDANGILKKQMVKQTKGENWAIRKSLHAETVSGRVHLKRIKENPVAINSILEIIDLVVDSNIKKQLKERSIHYKDNITGFKKYLKTNPVIVDNKEVDKVFIYETIKATASRKSIDISFDNKKIEKITDLGIQKILLNHLKQEKYHNVVDEKNKPIPPHELAFNEEGIEEMNKNIKTLNEGKPHQPIKKVRLFEDSKKFQLGLNGNRKSKFVETAKGTNLFFGIYQDENLNKKFITVPLETVIENQKQGLKPVPQTYIDEKTKTIFKLINSLSVNDLVFVPKQDEIENIKSIDFNNLTATQTKQLFNVNDFSGYTIYFTPNSFAKNIAAKELDSSFDSKLSKDFEGKTIKDNFIKLKVNRLGQIVQIGEY